MMKLLHIGMLVIAANAAGEVNSARRNGAENKAITAIRRLGGRVDLDEKKPGKPAVYVSLNREEGVTDAGLVHLKELAGLEELWLTETTVTDAGLVHLKGLTRLEKLNLQQTKVGDAGLVH